MSNSPFVSVIMAIRNEADSIQNTLQAILKQDYPADRMEIIVADGHSSDDTVSLVTQLQAKHSNIRLIQNPSTIVSPGLNAALRQAKGEVIVRVDGHTEINPDYVRCCVEELEESQADNVGGKMTAVGQSFIGKAIALATSHPFGIGSGRFHYSQEREWVDTVYLGAWKRDVFDRIGLFDEMMVRNQDDEFNYRLREKGGKILLSPKIQSKYLCRNDLRSLWRQYFQYGYWKVRVMQKHSKQMQLRQYAPAIAVAGGAVLAVLGFWIPSFHNILSVLVGLYIALNLISSFTSSLKEGVAYLGILPFTFTILHLSYGAGFLAGLLKFRSKSD